MYSTIYSSDGDLIKNVFFNDTSPSMDLDEVTTLNWSYNTVLLL